MSGVAGNEVDNCFDHQLTKEKADSSFLPDLPP